MIFFIPLLLFITLIVTQNEKIAELLWLSLGFCSIYLLVPKQNVGGLLRRKISLNFFTLTSTVFIFLSIFLLVKAAFSNTYFLGGDDSRLFYIYPSEYLKNFALNVSSKVGPGSVDNILPPISIFLFVFLLQVIKSIIPFINIQALLYSLNMILGIVFFYKFISYSLQENKTKDIYIKLAFLATSFMYVFSIFNSYILYNAKLLAIFLVSTFPFCAYLFIKSVREKRKIYLVIISIIATVFSYFAVMLPWFAGVLLVTTPFIGFSLWNYKKRLFFYSVILVVLLIIFNLYWIIFIPSSSIMLGSSAGTLTSEGFRAENAEGIRSTALVNRIFYPQLNLFHYNIQANFNWSFFTLFKSWYLKILPLNIIFFSSIVLALVIISKKSKYYRYYLGAIISFILTLYFYTVHFGMLDNVSWGVEIFIWINNHVPGFVIFRNMYDKFAPALAFVYALVFGISLVVIFKRVKSVFIKNLLLIIISIVILLNAKPLLLNEFDNTPVWSTNNIYTRMSGLNPDYLSAAKYISELPTTSGILTLPLPYGNVSIIKDSQTDNNFYLGVSPLMFFSGKNDYSGIMSFGDNQAKLRHFILEKEYIDSHNLLKQYNIDYVLVLNNLPDELKRSYLFYPDLFEAQDEAFKTQILGEEVARFGNSYTLYKFNK